MLTRLFLLFFAVLPLASCSIYPPYQFDAQENFTFLTLEKHNLPSKGLVPLNTMYLYVERCRYEVIGRVDMSGAESQRIKIPTDKPFFGEFSVSHNEIGGRSQEGSQYLAFRPREDRDYKLVYKESEDHFTLELLSTKKGGAGFEKDQLLIGSRYISECPAG